MSDRSSDRFVISTEQAISMLPDGDTVHTFRSSGLALIGADWDRAEVVKAIEKSECELGGPMCQAMDHGLVVNVDGRLFVECKKGFDYEGLVNDATNPI